MHDDPVGKRGEQARLGATAYVAWAVFGGGRSASEAGPTLAYLLRHEPATLGDPYTVALVAVTLLPFSVRMSGWIYLISALALGAVFIGYAVRLQRAYSDALAKQTFRYSIVYLSLLFIALLADHYFQ